MYNNKISLANSRVGWVDTAKYVGIMFVMMSHLETNTDLLSAIFQPFFLAIFFFASGYVYRHPACLLDMLKKKTRGLLIPWLVFSVFNIFLSQILTFNEHAPLMTELGWNFLQIRGLGDGVWFLPALFMAFLPFYYAVKWYQTSNIPCAARSWLLFGVSFGLSVVSFVYTKTVPGGLFPWKTNALPWHLEFIFQGMFMMVAGFLFRERLEQNFNRHNGFAQRCVLALLYLLLALIPMFMDKDMTVPQETVWFYATQILGVATIVSICKVIKSNPYISYVGRNTVIYFALHGKVYSVGQTILKKFYSEEYKFILSNKWASALFAVAFTMVLSLVLLLPAWAINRWLPFVLGRKK